MRAAFAAIAAIVGFAITGSFANAAKDYHRVTPECDEQTDLTDWEWLASTATQRLLANLNETSVDRLKLSTTLRKQTTVERARLAVELVELRKRASEKFSRAGAMFFTRKGYEQATDEWIARYKTTRFAGQGACLDLCCGIGGDAIGLSQSLPVKAIDCDPATAFCASHNLACYAQRTPENDTVTVQSAEACHVENFAAWHIDPDRRATGQRVSQLASMEPSVASLHGWLTANPHGAIKLAPATRLEDWPFECEREWIGRAGECRQQVAWHGDLMTSPGEHRATIVAKDSPAVLATISGRPAPPRFSTTIDPFVYDVQSSVLAAGLVGPFAAGHRLTAWSASDSYLTGALIASPLVATFEVIEVLPLRVATIADWLSERSMGHIEIKHRLAGFDPDRLRKQLRPRGDNDCTLLLAAQGARKIAVAARRITCNDNLAESSS